MPFSYSILSAEKMKHSKLYAIHHLFIHSAVRSLLGLNGVSAFRFVAGFIHFVIRLCNNIKTEPKAEAKDTLNNNKNNNELYSLSQQSNLHENFKSIHSMQSQWFRSKIEDFFKYAGSFHFNRAFTLNAQFYRLKFNGKFGRSNDTKKTSKALEFAFIFMRT